MGVSPLGCAFIQTLRPGQLLGMDVRTPPDGSLKSLLLLEKVPPSGGGCGGDPYEFSTRPR